MSLDNQVSEKPGIKGLPFVEADLNYLTPMAEKPFNYVYEPPSDVPRHNLTFETHRLPIRNARSITQELSLDKEGFVLAPHSTSVHDFYNEDEIRNVYYPEAEQFLKQVTGADRVIVFDHNLRNAQRAKPGDRVVKEPVKRVHNDFTIRSGYRRARDFLTALGTEDPDQRLQGRFSIINIWRPIVGPVQRSPLAVCDAQSLALEDFVATDLIYPDWVGETYTVVYNPAHQWFYFPELQKDEAILIKCFDSAEDGRARFAAHTAFEDSVNPVDAPPRESIELRTLVFYPN